MRVITRTATLISMIVLSGPWSMSFASDGDSELGAELYTEFCMGCHGENKTGLSNFNDDAATFAERLEGITENMPDFAGVFEDDEVAAMFAYLNDSADDQNTQ